MLLLESIMNKINCADDSNKLREMTTLTYELLLLVTRQ